MEQNECLPPLKSLIGRQYFFQKQTQFSQGKNVLDAPLSNIDVFLLRHTCVSTIELNNTIWKKMYFYPPFKPRWAGRIPSKN
jgi:hypothetical protein